MAGHRERVYQVFGSQILDQLVEIGIRERDATRMCLVRIHERNLTGTLRGTPAQGNAMVRILHASLKRRRGAEGPA